MRRELAVIVIAVGLASPALAAPIVPDAVYSGTLTGTITSGSATRTEDFTVDTIALAGTRLDISFTAQVTYDYVDPDDFGRFYPRYVVNSLSVSVTPKAPLGVYNTTQSNDYNLAITGGADFIGNATNGRFIHDYVSDGDTTQFADFTFANARSTPARLSGSGVIKSHQFSPSLNRRKTRPSPST